MANSMPVSCYPVCLFVIHKNTVFCTAATSTWCKWTVIERKMFFSSVFPTERRSSNANPFLGEASFLSSHICVFSFSFAAAFRGVGPLLAQCLEMWKKLIDTLWIYIIPVSKNMPGKPMCSCNYFWVFYWFGYRDDKHKLDFKMDGVHF